MKNTRSQYMLSLVSKRTLNKTNSAVSDSTAVNNENMDIPGKQANIYIMLSYVK